jgi:glycine cleavage system T protein (aminomethyltransferase)
VAQSTLVPPAGSAREQVPPTLARTPLHDLHVAAGAKLIEFAGFEMPAYYGGSAPVRSEHMAVREACGVFDVSHMGQLELAGARAQELLQSVFSNDVARMEPGAAQYGVICDERGGVLDDVISYRLAADRFLVVTNAANHARDSDWIAAHAAGREVELRDRAADYAMLAVQGPAARAIVGDLAESELPARMRVAENRVAGVQALACGTGYTGEDGVELLLAPREAATLWRALVAAGARPAGLAARDTLRIEACLPLYGNELTTARGPIEAGLGWCCHEQTGFVGADAVRATRERGPAERVVPFRLEGPGIARAGNPVIGGGEVTSGTLSPCLGVGIGLAYVPAESAQVGTRLQIDVRGQLREALVCERPLVRRRS